MTEKEKIAKIRQIYQNFLQQWHQLRLQAGLVFDPKKNNKFVNKNKII